MLFETYRIFLFFRKNVWKIKNSDILGYNIDGG